MSEETVELQEETNGQTEDTPPIDSKYRLIIVAARRSKQLQRGARARVDADPKRKLTRVAMDEVMAGKVQYNLIEDN
jgi:DNA-directed RNA polymerase subunit omega